jgi:RNA polymerase sigma factor (sigma-70 family)
LISKTKYQNLSDEEVVSSYRLSSDKELVGVLFERYAHLVFGVSLKYLRNKDESHDMVINIFEKLLTDLKNFEILKFRPWLHSVTRNHCLMYLRKANRPGTEKDIETLQHKLQEEENDKPEKEFQLNRLDDAMKDINEEQRICITLFYLSDKSYQQIAAETGWELNKIKSHIQNGKRNLKIILESRNETVR